MDVQLWAWDDTNKIPVKLVCNADGKLIIDPSEIFEDPPTNGEAGKAPQSNWAFDHWKDPIAHQDTGGKCGIRTLTMTGHITLTPYTDYIHQYLNPNGSWRRVTLATAGAVAGDRWIIRNTDTYTSTAWLLITQGATDIEEIYANGMKAFIFDGTNWITLDLATAHDADSSSNLAFGYKSIAYGRGFALGANSRAYDYGVAVGRESRAQNSGVAIGDYARGNNRGVAIGAACYSQEKRYAIALGYFSYCARAGETAININGSTGHENHAIQGRLYVATANATPVTMIAGGYSAERFTIKANSVLAFDLIVAARDNVAGDVAMYKFYGVIKRDGAGNTVLSTSTKTVVHEDDASWDCDIAADDTNEALAITVTGDATNPTHWVAVLDGVEAAF